MYKSVCGEKLTNRETIQGSTTRALIVTISPSPHTYLDEQNKASNIFLFTITEKMFVCDRHSNETHKSIPKKFCTQVFCKILVEFVNE